MSDGDDQRARGLQGVVRRAHPGDCQSSSSSWDGGMKLLHLCPIKLLLRYEVFIFVHNVLSNISAVCFCFRIGCL